MPILTPRATNANHGTGYPSNQAKDSFSGSAGKEKATRVKIIEYDGTDAFYAEIPAVGTAHPAASWIKFKNFTLNQKNNRPGTAELTLNYEQDEIVGGGEGEPELPPLPDDDVVESGGIIEVDIVQHPNFHTANGDWDDLSLRDFYNPREGRIFLGPTIPASYIDEDGETKANANAGATVPAEIVGMDKYVVGTGTVSVREYSYEQPAHVIPDSGKRGVPPGYAGTDSYWLIMSGVRGREGAFWVRDMVYQYSAKAISSWIYPAV